MRPSTTLTAVPVPPRWAPAAVWRAVWPRGLAVLVGNTVIALLLSVAPTRDLPTTWVYAQCIGLSAWLFLDGGRVLAARWLWRADHPHAQQLAQHWPGWPVQSALIAVGSPLAFVMGGGLADALTGQAKLGLIGTDPQAWLYLLVATLLGSLGMTFYFHLRGVVAERDAALARAQQAADQAQLHMLQAQLQPHMLFNTLANLRALIPQDPQRALAMLDHLNAFLRRTLAASRTLTHPLADEFAAVQDYLALMQVRMGQRLRVELHLPPELARHPVPAGLLQPLVENAIRHGLEPQVEGGCVRVSAAATPTGLRLMVQDDGVGLSAEGAAANAAPAHAAGSHFGLTQVRQRLQVLFGGRAHLALQASKGGQTGTVATIDLPLDVQTDPPAATQGDTRAP